MAVTISTELKAQSQWPVLLTVRTGKIESTIRITFFGTVGPFEFDSHHDSADA